MDADDKTKATWRNTDRGDLGEMVSLAQVDVQCAPDFEKVFITNTPDTMSIIPTTAGKSSF